MALRPWRFGATSAVAGIWRSAVPALDSSAELFGERRLRSVTANTRRNGEEFLRPAAWGFPTTTVAYPMDDDPRALSDLEQGRFGAAVLHT